MKTCAQLTSPFPKSKDPSLGDDATHSGTISIDQIKNKVLHRCVQILVCKGMVDHTKLAGKISHGPGQEGFPLSVGFCPCWRCPTEFHQLVLPLPGQ